MFIGETTGNLDGNLAPITTMLRFARRFAERRAGIRRPLIASLLISGKCNIACSGCTFDEVFASPAGRAPEPEMTTAEAVELIGSLSRLRLPALIFAGGEPLLRKDLSGLAAESRRGGMFTALFTNGTLIGPAEAGDIDSLFHICMVSVDGLEEHNDFIRGDGNYRRAMAGVEELLKRRRKTRVTIACVVNRWNVLSLAEFAEEMRKAGVDGVKFQANFLPEYQPSTEDAREGLRRLVELKRKHPKFIKGTENFFRSMEEYFSGAAEKTCFAENMNHIVISPSGKFSLCCYRDSVMERVREPGALERAGREERARLLAGCPGCHRYDEAALSAVFDGPLSRARPMEILENMRL